MKARYTLEQLVTSLTPTVIRRAHLADPGVEISHIRIHQHGHVSSLPGELLLAIGTDRPMDLAAIVAATPRTVAGIALRCPDDAADDLTAMASEAGLSLLFVHDDVDWMQAMALLQTTIDFGRGAEDGVLASKQDLFEVCDLAAGLVGGPVTIEDESGNLVAYSRDQQGGDQVRVQTLIARRTPAEFTKALADRGIPRQLVQRGEPVIVRGIHPELSDRVAIALRAGAYHLGFLWVLVQEPTEAQLSALSDLATHVSLQLMRRRSEDALARRLEVEQLAVLLHGGTNVTGFQVAAQLSAGVHWVVALDIARADSSSRALVLAQVEQALAMSPPSNEFTVLAGQLSNLLYIIVTHTSSDSRVTSDASALRDWLTALLTERGGTALPVHVGVGRAAESIAELPRSRREAEQALTVVRHDGGAPSEPLTFDQCWARASLARVMDQTLIADLENLTPLWRLRRHDEANATDYVPTLAAWLQYQGNVRGASDRLHIHSNTLRYRLDKLAALADVDLNDPDVRLILSLQLWTDFSHGAL